MAPDECHVSLVSEHTVRIIRRDTLLISVIIVVVVNILE